MTLLIVRYGLEARGLSAGSDPMSWREAPSAPAHLYAAAQRLLAAAGAIVKRLDAMRRETYEFMKLDWLICHSTRGSFEIAGRHTPGPSLFDTS